MRATLHPAIEDVTVETLLYALADPVRVAIFVEILGQECSANCSTFQSVLAKPIPKSTLSHHLRLLREAGLIRSERRGVEVLNSSRCAEVDARYPGLLGAIVQAHEVERAGSREGRKGAGVESRTKESV